MGSCCSSEVFVTDIGLENEMLSIENLLVLKAIVMVSIEKNYTSAMTVKLINVRNITKGYYDTLRTERDRALQMMNLIGKSEREKLEETIAKEKETLKNTSEVLNSVFSSSSRRMLLFSPSITEYVSKFKMNVELMEQYKFLRNQVTNNTRDGNSIGYLSKRLSGGVPLNPSLAGVLKKVCSVTSHAVTNPERRISYITDPNSARIRRLNTIHAGMNNRSSLNSRINKRQTAETLDTADIIS